MVMRAFKPTDEQRFLVRSSLGLGINQEAVRSQILQNGKPIAKETFEKHFAKEVENARFEKTHKVLNVIYAAAIGTMGRSDIDPKNWRDPDINAARYFINLQARGMMRKKFKLDQTKPIAHQINQLLEAAADGVITPLECDSFVAALKCKIDAIELQELKKRVEELENGPN